MEETDDPGEDLLNPNATFRANRPGKQSTGKNFTAKPT